MKNYRNDSITENDAYGYKTTNKALVDLNFMVSSLRDRDEEFITKEFVKVYDESPKYAVKWLFYLRDIMMGMGERRTFRICLRYLAVSQPQIMKAVMIHISDYGRFDDTIVLLDTPLAGEVASMYKAQLEEDIVKMNRGEAISLLAKWLPSINTSSRITTKYAWKLCGLLQISPKEYRKMLSSLRGYANVVETKISALSWSEINYESVPAKANLKYDRAFLKHDPERRTEYFEKILNGDGKLNVNGLMPYEIVHRMSGRGDFGYEVKDDLLGELMWKKIVNEGFCNEWGIEDAIVVADGSGSMYSYASGNTSVKAIEIANSLAIYFAEQLKGIYHNKAISFSERPRLIDLKENTSLKDKLEIMYSYSEIANTNIEAVFDMLLKMAISNEVPEDELPKQVLIISDMEFDSATSFGGWNGNSEWTPVAERLFDTIERKFRENGYKMPRLIFWNVCGRTDTIPKVEHEEGICLLSGFSQNAMKIASDKIIKNPYDALIQVLDSPRYEVIEDAIRKYVS